MIVEIVWVMGWVHRNLKDHNTESASGVVGVRDFGTAALVNSGLGEAADSFERQCRGLGTGGVRHCGGNGWFNRRVGS